MKKSTADGFPRRLQRAMNKAGLNQAQLAAQIGVTQAAVSKWLNGTVPKGDQLLALSNALKVSMERLLTGDAADPAPVKCERESPVIIHITNPVFILNGGDSEKAAMTGEAVDNGAIEKAYQRGQESFREALRGCLESLHAAVENPSVNQSPASGACPQSPSAHDSARRPSHPAPNDALEAEWQRHKDCWMHRAGPSALTALEIFYAHDPAWTVRMLNKLQEEGEDRGSDREGPLSSSDSTNPALDNQAVY